MDVEERSAIVRHDRNVRARMSSVIAKIMFLVALVALATALIVYRLRLEQPVDVDLEKYEIAGESDGRRSAGSVSRSSRVIVESDEVGNEHSPQRERMPEPIEVADAQCVDENGAGLLDVTVSLVPDRDVSIPSWLQLDPITLLKSCSLLQVDSDRTGGVHFEAPSGKYLIVARRRGRAPAYEWIEIPASRVIQLVLRPSVGLGGLIIDGRNAQPISGAVIVVFPRNRADGRLDLFETTLDRVAIGQRVFSANNGTFTLDEIVSETLEVHVEASGYPSADMTLFPAGQTIRVELVGSLAANGIVRDQDGVPIVGAKVTCYLRGKLPGTQCAETITNASGEFSLEKLPMGPLSICAQKEGFGFEKKFVDPTAGEMSFVDFSLAKELVLRGAVVDETGGPVASAHVRALDRSVDAELDYVDTDANGCWELHWVPPNHRVDVTARKDGMFAAEVNDVPLDTMTSIRIVMRRLGRLRGRVVDTRHHAVPHFEMFFAVSGVSYDEERRLATDGPWLQIDNSEGYFDVDLWPVEQRVSFSAAGCRCNEKSFDADALMNPQASTEVVLEDGEHVVGRILSAAGGPLSGVRIGVSMLESRGASIAPSSSSNVMTDNAGSFELLCVPRGYFEVVVESQELGTTLIRDLRASDFPRDFVMQEPGRISGRVQIPWRDPTSVSEVRVVQVGTWIGQRLNPDPDGRFEVGPLAPGDYEVSLIDLWSRTEADAAFETTKVVTVVSGATTDVTLDERARGTIRGTIHSSSGAIDLLAGRITVARTDAPDVVVAIGRVGDDARFFVQGLTAGRYVATLDLNRPGMLARVAKEVDLPDDSAAAEVEFTLGAAAVSGHVEDSRGTPLYGNVTLVGPDDGRVLGSVRVDDSGDYHIIPPASTPAIVWVTSPGHAEDSAQTIDLGALSGEANLRHRLDDESRIEVTVVDDRQRPIAGASVGLDVRNRPNVLPPIHGTSDAAGSARFGDLGQGGATIFVSKPHYAAVAPIAVVLDRGATKRITATLTRLATLEVHLVDDRGNPVGSGEVSVVAKSPLAANAGATPVRQAVDARGVAVFNDLEPGEKTILVADVALTTVTLKSGERRSVDCPVGGSGAKRRG